jgi:RNA polymerase sigma-70 factor (ECF subfamily)
MLGMGTAEPAESSEIDAEERRLIDRSATGDQEAFRQLVLRHHRLVLNVGFRAVGELSAAEDIAQEVFVKVYRALPGYRHDKPFTHWLHRVAANAVTDALRKRKPVLSLDALERVPHYRDTVALQVFAELSYDEIAHTLDIPLGTVMSRLNAAKRILREQLRGELGDEDEANTA